MFVKYINVYVVHLLVSLLSQMGERYNIYGVYGVPYNFSTADVYITQTGFSPEIDSNLFQYTLHQGLASSISIIVYAEQTQGNAVHLVCMDQSNTPIPGKESSGMDGPSMISKYTFDSPAAIGTTLKFKMTTDMSGGKFVGMCNIVVNPLV